MRARKGWAMKRREFIAWLTGGGAAARRLFRPCGRLRAVLKPLHRRTSRRWPPLIIRSAKSASMTGSATVTRGNAARAALKVADVVYAKDILQTDVTH